MIAPLPPDIIRHLLAAFVAIGPDAAQAAIDGLIRSGVMAAAEGQRLFFSAMVGVDDGGHVQ